MSYGFVFHITDVGVAHLGRLTNLTDLDLEASKITDVGLAHLSNLLNLKKLDLSKAKVTLEGIEQLKKTLPNLNVTK